MTDVFEFSEYTRNNLIYNFSTLTHDESLQKKNNFAQYELVKAAEKEAAAKKAAEEKMLKEKLSTEIKPESENKAQN